MEYMLNKVLVRDKIVENPINILKSENKYTTEQEIC